MLSARDALLSAMVMLKASARRRASQKRNLLATTQADTQRGGMPDIGVVPMRLEKVHQERLDVLLPAHTWAGISWSQALVIAVKLCWLTPSVGTRTRQTWQRQIARSLYEDYEPEHYQLYESTGHISGQ
jgi:hypothetical protein